MQRTTIIEDDGAGRHAAASLILSYKYRLNPTRAQHRALETILEQQRQLYNAALEERILAYAKGRSITEVEQSRSLTVIRADDPSFSGVQRRIQRATLKRLDRAYKSFFRRAKSGAGASSGFPKFKGREHFDGFSFDAFAQIAFDGKRLRFAGMPGGLRVHVDRPLPSDDIKNIWFKRIGRRWYCGFQASASVRNSRAGLGDRAVGVDWGTSVLAHLSTGEIVQNPRHGEALQQDLRRVQRAVARKQRGSKGRMKARRHLQAVQRRIANRRRNTMDKLSARLVKHFGIVAVEKIDAQDLMNAERHGEKTPGFIKRRRNREVLDAAPYMLRQMTAYKARREACELIEIDPKEIVGDGLRAQPTQRCSMCGKLHFKELTDDHVCTTPGPFQTLRLPRKMNAARVVLSLALDGYGISSLADGNAGGTVRRGASRDANADAGPRRLGNTGNGRPSSGRRGLVPLLTHARDARDPRLKRSPGW